MKLIDSHVHLDDTRLNEDFAAVLERATRVGISDMIVPAVHRRQWSPLKQICQANPQAWPAYGLHPYFIAQHQVEDLNLLKNWLTTEKPVAVGECGLDYHRRELDKHRQIDFYQAQLAIAREFDLPIIIHATHAVEDVTHYIRQSGHHKGMIHSFNGSLQQAQKLIDLGYLLGFGGAATYPRATRIRALVSQLPLDALLLETDAPDQPPLSHHGERNEPSYLVDVLNSVVECRTESREIIAAATASNAQRLFNLY